MPLAVVTGASGFIGAALCPQLVRSGWQLREVHRHAPSNLRHQADLRAVGEIGPDTDWTSVLEGAAAVVHLAAHVHVMGASGRRALDAYREINSDGTERLARCAAAAGVKRFVFLSSIKVNGEATLDQPFIEADRPAPLDAYGISKWEAEQALARVGHESGMEVVILRPPLVYGPGVKANFLSLLNVIARGWPLPFEAVRNQRSLIYVGNLVSAIVRCLEHPAAAGRTFLVADGEPVSTCQLTREIARALQRPARLFAMPSGLLRLAGRLTGRRDAVERLLGSLVIDFSLIRHELGWTPPFSLEDGLKATAAWFFSKRRLDVAETAGTSPR